MDDNKLRIITNAEELFRQYGFKSVTMDDIARQLGISKKTVYQFFADKQAIVTAVLDKIFAEDERRMEEIKKVSSDSIEEMIRISDYFRGMMQSMNPLVFHDMQRYYPKAWEQYQHHRQVCFRGSLIETINAGVVSGFFRKEIDVEVVAKMRLYQVELGFDQKIFPSQQYDFTHVQMQFFEHFLYGLCTQEGHKKIASYRSLML
jgi:TetR/AcrR family transcriptional regulator, cholesterol catabolism regulator